MSVIPYCLAVLVLFGFYPSATLANPIVKLKAWVNQPNSKKIYTAYIPYSQHCKQTGSSCYHNSGMIAHATFLQEGCQCHIIDYSKEPFTNDKQAWVKYQCDFKSGQFLMRTMALKIKYNTHEENIELEVATTKSVD